MNEMRAILDSHFHRLYARIEKFLVKTEAKYNDQAGQAPSEFLLEHKPK
ncbi:hypothetical protein [Georgfuchsia toluolica]|nr:hypothetical protein [Georgfuchsia toluolica]